MKPKEHVRPVQMDQRFEPVPVSDVARADRRPGWVARCGIPARMLFDRLIAECSQVSTAPVLDMRDFAWTASLREHWQAIRDEARAAGGGNTIEGERQTLLLHDGGRAVARNLTRCPRTAEILGRIPGLSSACFSVLAPGAHIPAHRGTTKGLITCHLGLVVPRDGDIRMRVHDRVVRWAEGETLVFDDTYDHEVWSDTRGVRTVLLIRFERPLNMPGKWLSDLIRRRPFARRAGPRLPF